MLSRAVPLPSCTSRASVLHQSAPAELEPQPACSPPGSPPHTQGQAWGSLREPLRAPTRSTGHGEELRPKANPVTRSRRCLECSKAKPGQSKGSAACKGGLCCTSRDGCKGGFGMAEVPHHESCAHPSTWHMEEHLNLYSKWHLILHCVKSFCTSK